jgi:translation initiation factor 2B subunit (eIF-2B alpha/beta/delta family)
MSRNYNDIPKNIKDIIEDKLSGSKQITIRLLREIGGLDRDTITKIYNYAVEKQPTLIIIQNVLKKIIQGEDPRTLYNKLIKIDHLIADNLMEILDRRRYKVATLSMSSTVINTMKILARDGYELHMYVSESRPGLEGIKMAEKLVDSRISTTLIIDALLPKIMEKADIAIIGCDIILQNKNVVNKVGSFSLALGSRYYNKPFIVLGDQYKIIENNNIMIKEGPRLDIYNRDKEIKVYNPLFEIIPSNLINKIVLDNGILTP